MKVKLDRDGRATGLPCHIEHSINEFESEEGYYEYLNRLISQYEQELDLAEPGQPLRSWYAPDEVGERKYQANMTKWQEKKSGSIIKEAVTEGIKAAQPKPHPSQIPIEYRVFKEGNAEDKVMMSERAELRRTIHEESEKAAELEAKADHRAAGKRSNRVAWLHQGLKKMERTPYSFQTKDREQNLEWAEKRLEEMTKWTPEQIEANKEEVLNLTIGWHDPQFGSDKPTAYFLEDPQNRSPLSKHEGAARVVRAHLPGTSARDLKGTAGTEDLIGYCYRTGGITTYETEKPVKKEPEPVEDEGYGTSQKEFEERRTKEGAHPF